MKIKMAIAAIAVASMAFGAVQSFADAKDDYIKTFGMFLFQRNGLAELKLNDAEFDTLVKGMKAMQQGGELPDNFQQTAQKMMEYLANRAEANVQEEAKKTEAAAADYWKELEKNDKIQKTSTGLAYEIFVPGDTSKMPKENSDVVVNYTGKLTNGKVFDSTERHGKPAEFNLEKLIPGFREGIQKIGKGGKARIYIPGKLGYGSNPIPGIPANSTLIFDIELLDLDTKAPAQEPAAQPAAQQAPAKK